MCQFLIGNVSHDMIIENIRKLLPEMCQFLIGNVSLKSNLRNNWKLGVSIPHR